jgi:hypothetical protein
MSTPARHSPSFFSPLLVVTTSFFLSCNWPAALPVFAAPDELDELDELDEEDELEEPADLQFMIP